MCSRYSLTTPPEALRLLFELEQIDDFPPRYNIAPSQPVLIVANDPRGKREARLVRWGLIPAWVKDPRSFAMLMNARGETAADKPSFRGALRHRRCLIPASAFYEWTGARGSRQPHLIELKGRDLFALAGISEVWLGADGSEIETMAILTTAANGDMAALHERMPVILEPADYARWLDCSSGSAVGISDLLGPLPDGLITITAVDPRLNNPRSEGADLQTPVITTLL
ncbi:DUF159 family protein [Hyphomicrobium methylovorum]|uniref:SOS response-associated peptidase family protein n=1 Tax=Hyphomicrobium methylovorum TaxID=84 RepID=UPI0015E691CB|nr:DUF159 family protein [Hyphomicrobium methylovorum]